MKKGGKGLGLLFSFFSFLFFFFLQLPILEILDITEIHWWEVAGIYIMSLYAVIINALSPILGWMAELS